jgi:purine-binding chemotaxis protein CheW
MSARPTQYCTFVVGDGLYGVDALRVQEIVQARGTTRVPLAPPAVTGLMNLRGQIVTALDMRARLGLPARNERLATIVVVHSADGAVGLAVDDIGDVIEAPHEDFEPPPDTLRGAVRSFAVGAYKLAGRLLLALDLDRIVDLQNGTAAESDAAPRTGAAGR